MTYLMSDIHGHYRKYLDILDKIGFSDGDDLYVLGDVVDRGPEPMALLNDMSMRANIIPILGNHDWSARTLLRRLNVEITAENVMTQITSDILYAYVSWLTDGGRETNIDFRKLSQDDRNAVLDYLEEFEPYSSIKVNGTEYILVHAGLFDFRPDKPLCEYGLDELIDGRTDYTKQYYSDKVLVTGHTPTLFIDPSYKGRIWHGKGHIALDCGAGFDLPLGCIRLDDMKEFYA